MAITARAPPALLSPVIVHSGSHMNRIAITGMAALLVLGASSRAFAGMSASGPSVVEPTCPLASSTAAADIRSITEHSADTVGMPGATTLSSATTTAAALPSLPLPNAPAGAAAPAILSSATTAESPAGATEATTAPATTSTSYERRKADQAERSGGLSQGIGEPARRKPPYDVAIARKQGLEQIARFLQMAQRMKPNLLARHR
jgi:hypothetical protein